MITMFQGERPVRGIEGYDRQQNLFLFHPNVSLGMWQIYRAVGGSKFQLMEDPELIHPMDLDQYLEDNDIVNIHDAGCGLAYLSQDLLQAV